MPALAALPAPTPPEAPECPTCLGLGRLEVIVGGVHTRTVDCWEKGCLRGRLEQVVCWNCDDERELPEEDAAPHFCKREAEDVAYLCPSCAGDPLNHLERCGS